MIRRLLSLTAVLVALAPCGAAADDAAPATPADAEETIAMETVVTLKTTRGDIVVRFFPESAPEHVKNFIALSKDGTYTGTLFHRIIPGFMIQGGDPNSKDDDPSNDGFGGVTYKGPDTTLDAEFNDRKHVRGTLSMARSQDPNSARSQFFVMHAEAKFLDNQYTIFGEVIDGIEFVDEIVNTPRNSADRPNKDQKILEVTVEEWETEKVDLTRDAMWEEEKLKEAEPK